MRVIDSLMKSFLSNQDLETILKELHFYTRKFSTISCIRTNNISLVTTVPSSSLHQFQALLKEKLLLLLNLSFQEQVLDHLYPSQPQKRLPNSANSPISLSVSDCSTETLVKVVLVLNHSLISSTIQLDLS